jgi:hypothetical protein
LRDFHSERSEEDSGVYDTLRALQMNGTT